MKVHSYWRSTTSYRVRIALNLKKVTYQTIPVDLTAGEQNSPEFNKINPGQAVPALVLDNGAVIPQSMAILEWLEETFPEPALLPDNPEARAKVRAAALGIASDVHPVNNLRVTAKLKSLGHGQEVIEDWMNDWMTRGFKAFLQLISDDAPFCFGDSPGLADICLIPQLYNAHRWGCDLASFSRLTEIETRCLALPAFDAARPENQPNAS